MPYVNSPYLFHHELIIGVTYKPATLALKDAVGAAHDLTGATGLVKIRPDVDSAAVLTPTWSVVGAATDGVFTWESTPAQTAALTAGTYVFSVQVTFADGTISTIVEGRVEIRKVATP